MLFGVLKHMRVSYDYHFIFISYMESSCYNHFLWYTKAHEDFITDHFNLDIFQTIIHRFYGQIVPVQTRVKHISLQIMQNPKNIPNNKIFECNYFIILQRNYIFDEILGKKEEIITWQECFMCIVCVCVCIGIFPIMISGRITQEKIAR